MFRHFLQGIFLLLIYFISPHKREEQEEIIMTLTEKTAYLKGLAEGLELDAGKK